MADERWGETGCAVVALRLAMLQTRRRTFGNIVGHATGVSDLSSLTAWAAESFDPRLIWDQLGDSDE